MKILMIDMSNLIRKNAFASVKANAFENGVWRECTERTICDIFSFINKFEADRCIIAMDADTYWRKKIYPEYKANRRQYKEDCVLDFDSLDAFYAKFMNDFEKVFLNIYCMQVSNCEADDVIAVVTRKHPEAESVTIISADKDFNQLKKQGNVVHYNPTTRHEVLIINPQRDLDMKIIRGDINDNIPPIKRGIGPKKAEALLNNHVDIKESSDTLLVENFTRNKILIDFDFIPLDISNSILKAYESITVPIKPSNKHVFNFLMKYNAPKALDAWQQATDRVMALQ